MCPFRGAFLPVDGGCPLQFCSEARFNGLELPAVLWAVAFRRRTAKPVVITEQKNGNLMFKGGVRAF